MERSFRSRSPSISLDADFSGERSRTPPAQKLLVAILRRAIWDFVLYKEETKKSDPEKAALAEEAAGWLFWDGQEETDPDGLYTFRYICEVLNLEPARVRSLIAGLERDDIQRMNNHIKEE